MKNLFIFYTSLCSSKVSVDLIHPHYVGETLQHVSFKRKLKVFESMSAFGHLVIIMGRVHIYIYFFLFD